MFVSYDYNIAAKVLNINDTDKIILQKSCKTFYK